MTRAHLAEGQVLFREGDPSDCVFRVLSGAVDVLREIDGEPILLGSVDAGQFIGEMGVVENRSRCSACARAEQEPREPLPGRAELVHRVLDGGHRGRSLLSAAW